MKFKRLPSRKGGKRPFPITYHRPAAGPKLPLTLSLFFLAPAQDTVHTTDEEAEVCEEFKFSCFRFRKNRLRNADSIGHQGGGSL